MSVTSNKKRFWWFLFVLGLLFCFYPYEFQDSMFNFLQKELLTKVFFIIVLFIILSVGKSVKTPHVLALMVFVHMFGFLLSFVVHGGLGQYIGEYVTIIMVSLLILVIKDKIGILHFFELYNKWIMIMAIGGCVALMMAITGIGPIQTFISHDLRPAYSWGVSYTNVYYDNFIRYAGFFDEPGAMGYWMVFAIAINRLFIKNKWVEWGLLVLGLFSFSFGFIVQALVYILLFTFTKRNTVRSIVTAVAVFGVALFIYNSQGGENSTMYDVTFGRYEKLQEADQKMGGRQEMSDVAKKYFFANPLFGLGRVQFANIPYYMQDNPYETLAKDGIVGTIYLYFPFLLLLYWGIKRKDGELIRVWIFMVLSFMHRPFHPAPLYYFIFYSIVYMYYLKMRQPKTLYEKTA